jgi:hypothetical protein
MGINEQVISSENKKISKKNRSEKSPVHGFFKRKIART